MSPLFLMKVNFCPSKLFLSRHTFPTSVPRKVFFGFEIWTETERENVSSPPNPKKKRKKKSGFLPFLFPRPSFIVPSPPPIAVGGQQGHPPLHSLSHRGRDSSFIPPAFGLYFSFPPNSPLLIFFSDCFFFLLLCFIFLLDFFFWCQILSLFDLIPRL